MEVLNLQLKNVQNIKNVKNIKEPGLLCTAPTHLALIGSGSAKYQCSFIHFHDNTQVSLSCKYH